MMFKKLYFFILKANQIIFFIGSVVFLIFLSSQFFPELFGEKYEKPKVIIIQNENNSATPSLIEYKKHFIESINDTHVFRITADAIYDTNSSNYKVSNMYSYYDGEKTINLMFVSDDGSNHLLFKNHHLIAEYSLSKIVEQPQYSDELVVLHKDFSISKNVYSVIRNDSNKDGYFSEDDRKALYYSDYNGLSLKIILEDINDYSIIGVDKIMIKKYNADIAEFYLFNLATGLLNKLNTDIDL